MLHTAETPETSSSAENVARYLANSEVKASAHVCSDNDSLVFQVRSNNVAWAAPGANRDGYQHELSGTAKQSASQWSDDYSKKLLNIAAQHCAKTCKEKGIPLVFLKGPDILAGKSGITTHHEVNQAYHRSNHWDPGPNFPWRTFVALVKEYSL